MNGRNVLQEKRAWRAFRARVRSLPREYRVVYREIARYFFKVCCAGGVERAEVLPGVLELFEAGAAEGRPVLEVTGRDVAAFCDDLLRD